MQATPELLESLAGNPWFAGLPLTIRRLLISGSDLRRYTSGELIFRQGDPSASFCGLLEGTVKISSLRRDGREAILSMLEQGVWFGEIGLIDDLPRTHDAHATGSVVLLQVARPAFASLMQNPPFQAAILLMMASRLRNAYRMMEDASLGSQQARVAHRLLVLARGDASMAPDLRQRINLPQESLAMMLGITRQTLSKILRQLTRQGAIQAGYRKIEILDPDLLSRLARDN